MLFSEYERFQYARSPLVEVIYQLRFPTIQAIEAEAPEAFRAAVREDFPNYTARKEQVPPKVTAGEGGKPKVEPQPPVTNHTFLSEDNRWKLNMTKDFIAVSTLRYTRWEDFAHHLDKVLARFIQIYHPTAFSRTGLRYVNAISRRALGLTDLLWDDLIRSPYIGILGEPDVDEKLVSKSALTTDIRLEEGVRLKIHAGPGLINGGKQDPEPKFILDGDVALSASTPADQVPAVLEKLHRYSVRFFHGAIMPELHEAMGPTPIEE